MNKAVEPLDELSDTWRKLLLTDADHINIPSSLTDDPWSKLLHAQGIKIVDLQDQVQISLSELEVEQALQIMQEQPIEGKNQG
jgi:hypothetical protein